jgi:CheY-like chemotaxis protein
MVPKKILLAEDDQDDLEFFTYFLHSRSDIELTSVAENGEEVIDALKKTVQLPDMIIMDQNMPRQNGLQTLLLLKKDPLYKDIPVFIYSTYADENLQTTSVVAGAKRVFTKPYSFEGYQQMIDAMLLSISEQS